MSYVVFLLELTVALGNSFLLYIIDTDDGKLLVNVIAVILWIAAGVGIAFAVTSVKNNIYIYDICGCNLGIYSVSIFEFNFARPEWKKIPVCNIVVHLQDKKADFYKRKTIIDCGILAALIGADITVVNLLKNGSVKSVFEKVLIGASAFFVIYMIYMSILCVFKEKKIRWQEIPVIAECIVLAFILVKNELAVMTQGYVFYLMTQAVLAGELAACVRYKLQRGWNHPAMQSDSRGSVL